MARKKESHAVTDCVKKTQREEIKNEWVTDYETAFPFPVP